MLALWIARGQGALWRKWVWREAGGAVRAVAASRGGRVRPLWTGWRVEAPGFRADWRGGLAPPNTTVQAGRRRATAEGLLDAEGVERVLAGLTERPPDP